MHIKIGIVGPPFGLTLDHIHLSFTKKLFYTIIVFYGQHIGMGQVVWV